MEDASGRILLKPSKDSWNDLEFNINEFSHGSVIAVKGTEKEGAIVIDDICIAGPPPQQDSPKQQVSDVSHPEKGRYIALISGLADAPILERQIMLNYIQGQIGSPSEQDEIKNIVKVFVAGNSFTKPPQVQNLLPKKDEKELDAEKKERMDMLRDLDVDLASLASSVELDIMPGENDPTNFTLPHQPLNSCLFPLSSKLTSFNRVSAPHMCSLDNTLILGTSGEELHNIKQFITLEDPIEIVQHLLCLRHIAPTAPDTLAAYPSEEGLYN